MHRARAPADRLVRGGAPHGAKALWRGLRRLHGFTLAVEAVTESQTSGQGDGFKGVTEQRFNLLN